MDHPTALLRNLFALIISLDGPDQPDQAGEAVAGSLTALVADLRRAVPSYRGLQLTITQHGYPVVLTAFTDDPGDLHAGQDDGHADRTVIDPSPNGTAPDGTAPDGGHPDGVGAAGVVSSLRLPLELLNGGFEAGSRVVFYAATRGALVDLAADLTYAVGATGTNATMVRYQQASGPADSDGDRTDPGDGRWPGISLDTDLPPSTRSFGLSGLDELSTINQAVGVMIDHGHHPDEVHATLRRHAAAASAAPHAFAVALLAQYL